MNTPLILWNTLENEKIKALQLETQHRLLLNHLQPHVLFNMLSTLKSIINNNPTEAADFTVKLSNFLRKSLQNDSIFENQKQ